MAKSSVRKLGKWFVWIVNIVCIISIFIILWNYSYSYHEKIYEQNIRDISNLNKSAATIAEEYFGREQVHITNIAAYIKHSQFSLEETLDYIMCAYSTDREYYQLLDADYLGYVSDEDEDGGYREVNYSNASYYEMHSIIKSMLGSDEDGVRFVPEFTDSHTALKSFALCKTVDITGSDGKVHNMVLMSVSSTKSFIDSIQLDGGYKGMSVVLIDNEGNYIVSNSEFKSDNFYKYLYVFNNLSLDKKNEIKDEVNNRNAGYLTYADYRSNICVYNYMKMDKRDWYCVSCVAETSFHSVSFEFRFTIMTLCILMIMFVVDLFWLNRLNLRLKISMRQEKEANDAKSEFLSHMSHDIRTPMNAILGLSKIGREETRDEVAIKYFDKICSSGQFLLGLVNDILDMSRIETGRVEFRDEPVDISLFYKEILELVIPLADERNLQIVFNNDAMEADYVFCDKIRMQQIYMNILSNAIKFSPPGSRIEWNIETDSLENGICSFTHTIRDYGCGMSEEFLSRIFQPFEQEYNEFSNEKPSSGLGLAICNNLVNQLGGSINVESRLGEGSMFLIHLTHKISESPKAQKMGTEDNAALSGKRVLLVEDHPMNTEIAVYMLEQVNMIVTCAVNGQEAVDMFTESDINYYDVILMDMRMPVMNGIEATKLIRALDRADAGTITIIAMTADAYETDRVNSFKAGMNEHLSKPIDPNVLFAALRRFCT